MASAKVKKKTAVTKKVVAANVKKVTNKKAVTKKVVKWQDLTTRQQAALKRQYRQKIRHAQREIDAGGYSWQKKTKDGWDVFASNEELVLHITPKCVASACRSNKKDCVIARAIKKQQPFATGWLVGKNICMIFNAKEMKVIRYGTSGKLAKALDVYDRTGHWQLQPGYYVLKPLPAGYRVGTRWKWYKGSGGKASKFKGMSRSAPTRSGTYLGAIRKI
jgi:hypothetical protein